MEVRLSLQAAGGVEVPVNHAVNLVSAAQQPQGEGRMASRRELLKP